MDIPNPLPCFVWGGGNMKAGQGEVKMEGLSWLAAFAAGGKSKGRKILEKLLVDLERVFKEEGSYINKPLTLSSETLEYLSNKLGELKGVPGSATQSTNSSMGLTSVSDRSSGSRILAALSGRVMGGEGAANEEKELEVLLRRLRHFFKAINYVRIVERDRQFAHVCELGVFPSLQLLEVQGLPLSCLRGLPILRAQLKVLKVQRTAISRIEELVGPSREEALGAEECKGGSFVSTDWRKLEHLCMLHCELVAVGYDAMARLPSLQHLELQHNQLTSMPSLGACHDLKQIDLSFNFLRSVSFLDKGDWSSGLRTLCLRNNEIRSTRGVEGLVSLRRLDLGNNRIRRWDEVQRLAQLPQLEKLWLEGNPVADIAAYRIKVFALVSPQRFMVLDSEPLNRREIEELRRRMYQPSQLPAFPQVDLSFGPYGRARSDSLGSSSTNASSFMTQGGRSRTLSDSGARPYMALQPGDLRGGGEAGDGEGEDTEDEQPELETLGDPLPASSLPAPPVPPRPSRPLRARPSSTPAAPPPPPTASTHRNRTRSLDRSTPAPLPPVYEMGSTSSLDDSPPSPPPHMPEQALGQVGHSSLDASYMSAFYPSDCPRPHGLDSDAVSVGEGSTEGEGSRTTSSDAGAADLENSLSLSNSGVPTAKTKRTVKVVKKGHGRRPTRVADIYEEGGGGLDDWSTSSAGSRRPTSRGTDMSMSGGYDSDPLQSATPSPLPSQWSLSQEPNTRPRSQATDQAVSTNQGSFSPLPTSPPPIMTSAQDSIRETAPIRPSPTRAARTNTVLSPPQAPAQPLVQGPQQPEHQPSSELSERVLRMREELARLEAELARQHGTPTTTEASPTSEGPQPPAPGPGDGFIASAPLEAAGTAVAASAATNLESDVVGVVARPPPRPVSVPPSTSTTAAALTVAERRSLSLDAAVVEAPQLSLIIPGTGGGSGRPPSRAAGGEAQGFVSPLWSLPSSSSAPGTASPRPAQAGQFLGDPALADTELSPTDLATLRLYLSEHVFAAGGSVDSFKVDSKRSVFVCLDFFYPETLLYLYRESILSDATASPAPKSPKPPTCLELLGSETVVLVAVTDHNVYVLDLGFAKGPFRDGPKPLLLGRHPLRSLDRVVMGFKAHWCRLEFDLTEPLPPPPSSSRASLFHPSAGSPGQASALVLQHSLARAGYTLITRDKAQTMRIINRELRPLANEKRLEGSDPRGKVSIDNREEAMLQTLHDPSSLRYYELLFQWFRQRPAVLPRTVLVTEDRLQICVEDFRMTLDTKKAGGKKLDKYSPLPAPGERLSVLLDVKLADVVEVIEEEDPRKITITVREEGLLLSRLSTWRLYSENRRLSDSLCKVLRSEAANRSASV